MIDSRRGFLRSLLSLPALAYGASEIDWERLLWTPKPIIVVPAMPSRRVLLTLEEMNRVAIQAIVPGITDEFFKTSPLLAHLRDKRPIAFARGRIQHP